MTRRTLTLKILGLPHFLPRATIFSTDWLVSTNASPADLVNDIQLSSSLLPALLKDEQLLIYSSKMLYIQKSKHFCFAIGWKCIQLGGESFLSKTFNLALFRIEMRCGNQGSTFINVTTNGQLSLLLMQWLADGGPCCCCTNCASVI